ncbi:MAG: sensor histidine kinase [Alphaproteobacteria bacterium]
MSNTIESGAVFPAMDRDNQGDPRRLAEMRSYDILDRLPPGAFDRASEMAADIFETPIAALRIVESDRIWCRSPDRIDKADHIGFPRFSGFTRPSIAAWRLSGDRTSRSLTMPLVAIEFGLRFHVSVPLTTASGLEIGTLCVIDRQARSVDKRQIRRLRALGAMVMDQVDLHLSMISAARDAETLAAEADHRVMNSLQFIAGLLDMQSRAVHNMEAAAHLKLAASRISAVARVHRHFAGNNEPGRVPLLAYLRRLCADLSLILDIPIEVEGGEASVPSSQILAIGFSVNELITNAKKHGAPPIKVSFMPGEGGPHRVSVMDEGAGLPPGFSLERRDLSEGLGMRVVTALASQISGSLAVDSSAERPGACFTIAFRPA